MKVVSFYIKGTRPVWGKECFLPVLSWAIRFFTWSSISHVLVHFKHYKDIFHVYLTKRDFYSEESFLNEKVHVPYIFEIRCSEDQEMALREYFLLTCGKQPGYYLQLIGIVPCILLGLFNIRISNPLRFIYGNSMTCAEIIAKGLIEVFKVDWFDGLHLNAMTEMDIINILDKHRGNHGCLKVRRLR